MSDVIISAEALGKRYFLNHSVGSGYRKFSDTLVHAATAPLRWAQQSRSENQPTVEAFWALKDVSFEIKRGEVVGIIGRNGAGKSTLLKILSRITEPTTGRITLRGRVASLLEVGTGFHPELSGRENIFLNGAILGMTRSEIKARFDEIVAFAEIEKFLDTPVKRYSSGMYVRLAFAVAAHLEPEILIVDEVLAVGDAQFQKKCLGKMHEVSAGGRTVLFVSHNLPAIQRLCTSSILLASGKVVTSGSTSTVVDEYLASSANVAQASGLFDLQSLKPNGIDGFRYLSAQLLTPKGENAKVLCAGEPFSICLTFEISRPHRDLIVGFAVHTSDGQPLFATHNNDFGRTYALEPGCYTVTVQITPNYLRQGRYDVSLGAISSGALVAHIAEAFPLVFENALSGQGSVLDDRIGALFIPQAWTTPISL